MKTITLCIAIIFSCTTLSATDYFVDQQNGNDSNNGTSISTAFETFDKAETVVSPGDTIYIVGTYANPSYNSNYSYSVDHDSHLWHAENTIRISGLNGSAGNYITIKPYDSSTILKGDGANIIRITNSSYLIIEGFEMEGEVDRIPLSTAHALQFVYLIDDNNLQGTATNPTSSDIRYRNEDETNDNDNIVEESDTYTDISNEDVVRPSYIDTRGFYMSNSNNIIISNNTIHHTPGTGLRVATSKFVDIVDNEVYLCSAKSYSGTHALVVTKTEPIGSSDYSIKILRNKIHDNYNEMFSWAPTKTIITPRIDEGKGISLQRNNTSSWLNGSGRILVANNLSYWNGFSGVHSNDGHRIDFINNTSYMNSYTNTVTYANEEQKGNNIGISASNGGDIKMINNIVVIDTDWDAYPISVTDDITNLVIDENIIYGFNGGTLTQDSDATAVDTNTTIANPLFTNAGNFDFSLQSNSPAVDNANATYAPSDDYNGETRDSNPDIGALEYIQVITIPDAPTNASATETSCSSIDVTWTDNADDEDGFKLYRSVDGGSYTLYQTLDSNVVSYSASGLDEDTDYAFEVLAYNSAGDSSASTSNTETTPTCQGSGTTLSVIHDAHVRNGSYKNDNYGSYSNIQVKETSEANNKRRAYLKFDLSGIGNVTSATLRVYNTGSNGDVEVKKVSSDSWSESTITWKNKPSIGALLDTYQFNGSGAFDIDVTDYVDDEAQGDGMVTFVLRGSTSNYMTISGKESGTASQLIIEHDGTAQRQVAGNIKNTLDDEISIYPNPTKSEVNIKINDSNFTIGLVEVYDSLGRLIEQQKISSANTSVNLKGPAGIYILKVTNNDSVTVKQILKQ